MVPLLRTRGLQLVGAKPLEISGTQEGLSPFSLANASAATAPCAGRWWESVLLLLAKGWSSLRGNLSPAFPAVLVRAALLLWFLGVLPFLKAGECPSGNLGFEPASRCRVRLAPAFPQCKALPAEALSAHLHVC